MQAVDADNALTLSWNGFSQAADANQAFTFVRFTDTEAGGTPFTAFFLDPGTNSCVVSNGVLKAGTVSLVELIFSNRAQTNSGFGGGLASIAYDVSTHASLFTISPTLQIVSSGTKVVVSWPLTSSNFTLQSSDTLSSPNWTTIIDPPILAGDRLVLARPITGLQQFFRLVK
jgi:hypothetical protein